MGAAGIIPRGEAFVVYAFLRHSFNSRMRAIFFMKESILISANSKVHVHLRHLKTENTKLMCVWVSVCVLSI